MDLKPADIRDVWPIVKSGLEIVQQSSCQTWIPEDIYAACVSGQGVLYTAGQMCLGNERFLVVQSQRCPIERVSKLLLWVAFDPCEGTAIQFASECEEIARDTGHTAIEFVTSIDKLGLLSESFGYKRVSSLYRKNLL